MERRLLLHGSMLVHVRSTPLAFTLFVCLILGYSARVAARPGAPPAHDTSVATPAPAPLSRLRTSPMLQAIVARMAERSPAFAAQCARLERARGLYLRMRLEAPLPHGRYVARSVIRRHEFGAIVADITLHAPPDLVETIAHELEHVLEQVDRLDLHRLSRAKGSGVSRMPSGDYETERAVAAGRRVAAEFHDGPAALTAAGDY